MVSQNEEDLFKQHVNSSINIFSVMFIIFLLIKTVYLYTASNESHDSMKQMKYVFTFSFATIFLLFFYFTNVSVTENKMICGEKNYKIAFYATIIPFILIYCLGVVLITILDGWIRCFSNTFGSSILSFCGLTEEISSQIRTTNSENTTYITNILNEIYINQDTGQLEYPEDIDVPDNSPTMVDSIKKYVYCKESIGEGIWHYLLGVITVLVGYNAILAENCNAFTVKKDEFRKYLNDKFEKN